MRFMQYHSPLRLNETTPITACDEGGAVFYTAARVARFDRHRDRIITAVNMHGVVCTVVLAALSLALVTHGFPNGAPQSVCYSRPSLTPDHPAGNASDAPGGYFIDSDLRDTNFSYNGSKQRNYRSKRKQYRILAV